MPLAERSKEKTAFISSEGLFEFNRLPFGLKTAPGLFQNIMDDILREFKNDFAMAYIDDVIVYSKTFDEHLSHLEQIFMKFRKNDIQAKPSKCNFAKPRVPLLGHIVTKDGILVDPEKVEVIEKLKPPTTVKEVRRFIGMLSYYRKFIGNFSEVAEPLINLTKKNVKFEWNDSCQKAFEILKDRITRAPILIHPDNSKSYILQTDASDFSVGAVLLQTCGEYNKPVLFLSHKMNEAQRKYTAMEREAYAIIYALKKLRNYLYGTKFTILTDHKPLLSLFSKQINNARIQRWAVIMSEFDFDIAYTKGKSNF